MPASSKTGEPARAANRQRLSHFAIKNLRPRERPYMIWDVLQRGLAVSIQPSGHAAFKCIYSLHGRPRWMHLADATAIGLADARKLVGQIMVQVANGKDPAAERRAARGAGTFAEIVEQYAGYAAKRNKSWKQADRLVRKYLLPKWGKMPAGAITRSDAKALVAAISAPIMANQILASGSAIFSWAIREEAGAVTINPFAGIERNQVTSRERVLSDSEIPRFWSVFADELGEVGAALKVLLLTGQRPGEVASMRREHIADGWWSLPGAPVEALDWPGTKNAASHRVWLSPQVQAIVGTGAAGPVFSGITSHMMAAAMRRICKKLGVERATPHDLRRSNGTMITGLGFGRDAMNRIQNHRDGGIASVYDRHQYADENRKIMEAVADSIVSLVEGGPANVLPFKAKKSS